jgi:AbrB family looped-hinge helix DNA binding protein
MVVLVILAFVKSVTVLIVLGVRLGKVVGASKVTVRYQVTIPEEVRKRVKINVGDTLVFYVDGNRVYVATEM